MQARSLVVVAVAWVAAAGCAQIWGIGDVPVPVDAAAGDALADAVGEADADAAPPDATTADTTAPDTTGADAPTVDSTLADTSASETSVPDTSAGDTPVGDTSLTDTAVADAFDAGCPTDPCVMATGLNHPVEIVSDDSYVYWTELGTANGSSARDGMVKRCPVSGCGAGPTVLASGVQFPRGIAIDTANVYFATAGQAAVQGGIFSCPLAGCPGLPTMLAPAGIPYGVTIDPSYVYWVDTDPNAVNRVPKDGGGFDGLYDAAIGILASPDFCVVDTTNIYVADANQTVIRIPIGGGAPTIINVGSGFESPLAVDQANLYFVSGSQICRAAKTSTDGGPAIAASFTRMLGLTLDGDAGQLYWADRGSNAGGDGTVGKVATDGGAAVQLGSSLASPEAVTVSGSHVFWISNGVGPVGSVAPFTGTLTRLAK